MSSALTFPGTCSLGHQSVELRDQAAFRNHYQSAHANTVGGYTAVVSAFTPSITTSSINTTSTGAHLISSSDPFAIMGILPSSLTTLNSSVWGAGTSLTPALVSQCLTHIGNECNPKIVIDNGSFCAQFLLLVLNNAATEDLEEAGNVLLEQNQSSIKVTMSWHNFFDKASDFFQDKNLKSTPRKWMRALDPVLWEIYHNSNIPAIQDVKRHGTVLSRRFLDDNGAPVAPHVVIPDLFTHTLNESQVAIRVAAEDFVTKSGSRRAAHLGLNDQMQGMEAAAYMDVTSTFKQQRRANKKQSGLGTAAYSNDPNATDVRTRFRNALMGRTAANWDATFNP